VFAKLVVTAADPLKEVPVSPVPNVSVLDVFAVIVPDPPKLIDVPLTVTLELVRPEFGMVVLIAEAGMLIVEFAAAVRRPCASTVNVETIDAEPYEAAVTVVLARLIVPVVVMGPPVKPVPVLTLVTVPLPPPPPLVN
jgi:hypothetical protein